MKTILKLYLLELPKRLGLIFENKSWVRSFVRYSFYLANFQLAKNDTLRYGTVYGINVCNINICLLITTFWEVLYFLRLYHGLFDINNVVSTSLY